MMYRKLYIIKKITILSLILLLSGIFASYSQNTRFYLDPKYGRDSISRINCAANLSVLNEFMKMDQFDYALPPWRKVFDECPASSRNIYLYGVRIFRSAVENVQNPERRKDLIDTLMLIYDRRIKNFGQEGLITGRKGIDILKYRPEAIQEAYDYLKKSVSLCGKETEEAVLVNYMQASVYLLRSGTITDQELIDNYHIISGIINGRIASGKVQAADALEKVETIFNNSGVNEDIEKTSVIMDESAEYDTLNSKALAAFNLAVQSAEKNDFVTARNYALEAAGIKPGWGDPFILIGNLYATSSYICNKDELQQKSVFWVAVDQFIKAKNVDTSLAIRANDLISRYMQYFPNAEDAFFYGISEGQEYTVGCWINEKTRIRLRKN
jgi:hypothetical protein